MTEPRRYPTSRILLHWLTVALVLVAAGAGLWIADLSPDDPLRLLGSRIHFVVGLLTALTLLARLVAWARGPAVALPSLPPVRQRLVRAVDVALYGAGLVMAGSGMATSVASGWPAYLSGAVALAPSFGGVWLREVHEAAVWTFFALVMVHVVGVLDHERTHGEALRPMLGGG